MICSQSIVIYTAFVLGDLIGFQNV